MMARDSGLQVERTVLAWRRTTLALAIATLVVARLTFMSVGASALVPMLLLAAGLLWVGVLLARRRGVAHDEDPYFDSLLPDGRLPAAVALIAAALCVGEIVGVLAQVID
jgi:uncharacterized membrane protein YidH (DUF202 family)